MTNWQSVALENIAYELKNIREILEKKYIAEGEWINHISDLFPAESTIECSVCHEEQPLGIDDNYCPNCGARMGDGWISGSAITTTTEEDKE